MDVLKIGDKVFSLEQFVKQVRLNGKDAVLKPLIRNQAIIKCAGDRGLSASDEALQKRFDDMRIGLGLYSSADMQRWMQRTKRTLDELEEDAEIAELTELLINSFERPVVEKCFAENKRMMDAVEISIITVDDKEAANELTELLREGTEDFRPLALEYSTDKYAKAGGYMGVIRRTELSEAVAGTVFGAKPDDILGPIETDEGFVIVKLHSLISAKLDAEREKEIRQILLDDLLSRNRKRTEWLI